MKVLPAALAGLLCSVSLAALLTTPAAAGTREGSIVVAQAQQTDDNKKGQHQRGQRPKEGGQGQVQQPKGREQPKGPQPQIQKGTPPQPKPSVQQQAPKILTPAPTPTPKVFPKATTTPPPVTPKSTTVPAPMPKANVMPGGPRAGGSADVQREGPKSFNRDDRGRFRKFGDRPSGGPGGNRESAPAVTKVPQGAYKQLGRGDEGPKFRKVDDIKAKREVRTEGGIKIVKEPGNRTIIRQDNRVFIRHDETSRLQMFGNKANTVRTRNGLNVTTVVRPGGVRIMSVVDARGNLVERRRWHNGRWVRLIDNRRHWGPGAKIGLGVGVGLGLAALTVALAPPVYAMPRRKYIVEYADASPDDLYDALSADPVERLDRRYTLDEIRYSVSLRDRMRRVDLDINFDFGAWDITPDQYSKLDRLARVINRIIDKHPDEMFMIEGHTDAVGNDEDNLSLSDRRAESVAAILTREFNVPPENLVNQGYGEQFLKVETQGPERINRRVTVRRVTPLMARDESVGPGERDYDEGDRGGGDQGRPDRYDDRDDGRDRGDDRGDRYDDRR